MATKELNGAGDGVKTRSCEMEVAEKAAVGCRDAEMKVVEKAVVGWRDVWRNGDRSC